MNGSQWLVRVRTAGFLPRRISTAAATKLYGIPAYSEALLGLRNSCSSLAGCMLSRSFLRKVGKLVPDYTAPQPKIQLCLDTSEKE
jgi:hypothetical protein